MYLLKGLLKWIILALIFILIIFIIVKYASKAENKAKKVAEPVVNIVENQKEKIEDTIDDPGVATESTQENLVYDSPDTASEGTIQIIIGSIILCVGANYIYKRKDIKGNS